MNLLEYYIGDDPYTTLLQIIIMILSVIILRYVYLENKKIDALKTHISTLDKECPSCPDCKCESDLSKCPDCVCPDRNATITDNNDPNFPMNNTGVSCPDVSCPDVSCPSVEDIVGGLFPGRNPGITASGKYRIMLLTLFKDLLLSIEIFSFNLKFSLTLWIVKKTLSISFGTSLFFFHVIVPCKDLVSLIKKLNFFLIISTFSLSVKVLLNINSDPIFKCNASSTDIKSPPFFLTDESKEVSDIIDARVLLMLGDSITTDHISPAGSIQEDSPAGIYLKSRQVVKKDFNSYGSRRGNHEIMMRGTFANIRIKNEIVPGVDGGIRKFFESGEQMSIYDAAIEYSKKNIPLVVFWTSIYH